MKNTKRWYKILLVSLVLILLTGCEFGTVKKKEKDMSKIHHIKIEVENMGIIEVELDGLTAPITVDNFIALANSGFYNGSSFHRIISGFMVQGGSPDGVGYGGSGKTIKGEFANNGVRNDISHVRGVISMARGDDNDSASSQFFIVHKDSTYLDGNYAGFGHVTGGMEVVDKIAETPVEDSNGGTLPENRPIIKTITVVD